ncbi:MAG: hypothetical protein U9Q62_10270 [Campylobacterota bacterium]|nr:hypothetical protein [Campylobacterota bacterium]
MNIPFRRIGSTPQEFEVTQEDALLKGTLVFKKRNLIFMQAHLQGKVSVPCDICAEQFDIMLDDEVELLLSDGIYNGSDEQFDIIEMDNGIDTDALLHAEIELIRSDYHSCENCKNQGS